MCMGTCPAAGRVDEVNGPMIQTNMGTVAAVDEHLIGSDHVGAETIRKELFTGSVPALSAGFLESSYLHRAQYVHYFVTGVGVSQRCSGADIRRGGTIELGRL